MDRKVRYTCKKCGGLGKVDHWPHWEPRAKRIDCPVCEGKETLGFDLEKLKKERGK